MAGRARLQALKDLLDREALEYFDVDPLAIAINTAPHPSHLDYVCALVESGISTTKQAATLSETLGFPVSYERLMAYLREEYGRSETESSLRDARSRASHCIAEQAQEIVDEPAYDSVSVQRARNRANSRQWLAERYNQSAFGSTKGTNVSISVGSLHLTALQSIPNIVTSDARTLTDNTSLSPVNHVQPTQQQALRSE